MPAVFGHIDLLLSLVILEESKVIPIPLGKNVKFIWHGIGGRSPAMFRLYGWRLDKIEKVTSED